ncbi:FAD-dependent oxidoreductase, partial [Mesorhizobium japonicum]|uniref:FAD-dependent oxidoreductase n=1 Tax=Mesorhizobium japonicum TaxID=2066070 RepID=UPI003B5A23C5
LVGGHARFTGPKALRVESSDGSVAELTARHAVVVSTGSAALLPDVPGLADVQPWTSRDATSAKRAPVSLAIIGGGVVGCE